MATGRKLVNNIVDNGNYYLYRHIRLDKNEPFYIGISNKTYAVRKDKYDRAYKKSKRTTWWNNITNKTEYEVEILMESNDYEFIKEKEIEFIALYGRRDIKRGCLVNMTDGGDGAVGCIASNETKKKISKNNWSRGKFGKDHPNSKRVYQYDLEGNFIKEWDSLADVGRKFNPITKRTPSFRQKTFKGFIWKYEFEGHKIKEIDYSKGIQKRIDKVKVQVYQYSLDNKLLQKHDSYSDAFRQTGISINGIQQATNRTNNICRGFIWSKSPLN